jgi:hypothetical protein
VEKPAYTVVHARVALPLRLRTHAVKAKPHLEYTLAVGGSDLDDRGARPGAAAKLLLEALASRRGAIGEVLVEAAGEPQARVGHRRKAQSGKGRWRLEALGVEGRPLARVLSQPAAKGGPEGLAVAGWRL